MNRRPRDRRLDVLWCIGSLALAYRALLDGIEAGAPDLVAYVGLHAFAAVLFLIRRPAARRFGSAQRYLLVVLSLLYVYALEVEPAVDSVLLASIGDFLNRLGIVLAVVAMAHLGRSYGVLPADRGLCTAGPYAWVRHPLYAAYVLMDIGWLCAVPTAWNFVVIGAGVTTLALRARWEEETLSATSAYDEYARHVPRRWIPTREARAT